MAKKWTNVAIGDLAEVDAEYIHEAFDEAVIYDDESDTSVGRDNWTWEEVRDFMTWRDVRDRINLMEQSELDMPAYVWLTSETNDGRSICGDNLIISVDKEMQDMPAGKDNTISFTLYDYSK